MRQIQFLLFFRISVCSPILFGQDQTENWISVNRTEEKITYLNVAGLSAFRGEEILVWVQEDFIKPLKMEEISDDIYKTKSYYLINKELKRYSLVDVIYYDEDKNVIRSFHYSHDYENSEFKYTSPIMKNSEMEKILSKCLDIIASQTSN